MADILEFQTSKMTTARTVRLETPAKVIIFPGVRIDRDEFSLADRISGPAKKPRARKAVAKSDD